MAPALASTISEWRVSSSGDTLSVFASVVASSPDTVSNAPSTGLALKVMVRSYASCSCVSHDQIIQCEAAASEAAALNAGRRPPRPLKKSRTHSPSDGGRGSIKNKKTWGTQKRLLFSPDVIMPRGSIVFRGQTCFSLPIENFVPAPVVSFIAMQ